MSDDASQQLSDYMDDLIKTVAESDDDQFIAVPAGIIKSMISIIRKLSSLSPEAAHNTISAGKRLH